MKPTGSHPIDSHHKRHTRLPAWTRVTYVTHLLEPEEELAAGHVVDDHVELLLGLEGVAEAHEEGVRDVLQDEPLRRRVRQLEIRSCGREWVSGVV